MEEMSEMLRNLPIYQELSSMYVLHLKLAGACIKTFTEKNLETISEIE